MKILVTGSSGFIGTHLVEALRDEHKVCCLDRWRPDHYVLGEEEGFLGDLRDWQFVSKLIKDLEPEIVIHLAALTSVAYSHDHPYEVFEANVTGTMNLAYACLDLDIKQFIYAGSSEEYGNHDDDELPLTEDSELRPNSPYAISKVTADHYLMYLHEAYGFPATVARPFNTYGRKSSRHYIVERIVTQMLKDDKVILGDPHPVRDFMFIDDHVNAYRSLIGKKKGIGEAFNFCTGRGVSIRGLAEIIAGIMSFNGKIEWEEELRRPTEAMKLFGSFDKAKRKLNWRPRYSLEEGLQATIDFWKRKTNATQGSI